jgi:cell shape-determining protein MreC
MKTKRALVIVAVMLAGSILASIALYAQQTELAQSNSALHDQVSDIESQLPNLNAQTNNLLEEKKQLQTQIDTLQNQTAKLRNQTNSLQNENINLQNENAELQNQLNHKGTKEPKIVTRLGAKDVRESPASGHSWSGQIRFYVKGEVWNVGTADARNVRLHVTLYQGDTVANETYIGLGRIAAGSYVDVASNIIYVGEALSNWTIIPLFD